MRVDTGTSYSRKESIYLLDEEVEFLRELLIKSNTPVKNRSKVYFCKSTRYNRNRFRDLTNLADIKITIKPSYADYLVCDTNLIHDIIDKIDKESSWYSSRTVNSNNIYETEIKHSRKYESTHLTDLFNNYKLTGIEVITSTDINNVFNDKVITEDDYYELESVMNSDFELGCIMLANYNIEKSLYKVCLLVDKFKYNFKDIKSKTIQEVIYTPEVVRFTNYKYLRNGCNDILELCNYCRENGLDYDKENIQNLIYENFKDHIKNFSGIEHIKINTLNIDIKV
jgi:hypothetical protein